MRKIKKLVLALLLGGICTAMQAQEFNHYFENKTLRLDYIFGGNADQQFILLDELARYPTWAGRQHHLDENALRGNGQIRLYEEATNQLIYTTSFSTLFQEWLSTPEARTGTKSFENVFLVPFPKQKTRVEVVLFDENGKEKTTLSHLVLPTDVLIHDKGTQNLTPHEYIHQATDSTRAINVVLMAEGFTANEMDQFMEAAKVSVAEIFKHKPFDKFAAHFNFIAVKSTSLDSGVSVPRKGEWKKTAVESNFDTFYSERYLTTNRLKKVHDLLAGIPYEHIIILANTNVYGGGGIYNSYTLTTTGHKDFKPVVVHEFGHSFAGLADEYFYEQDVLSDFISNQTEPWEQNITTLKDFDSKWKKQLKKGTPIPTSIDQSKKYKVGVYEGLPNNGIYKGELECRMRTNQHDKFCSVCQNAIESLIQFYID